MGRQKRVEWPQHFVSDHYDAVSHPMNDNEDTPGLSLDSGENDLIDDMVARMLRVVLSSENTSLLQHELKRAAAGSSNDTKYVVC